MTTQEETAPVAVDRSQAARQRLIILAGVLALSSVGLWVQARSIASLQDTFATSMDQLHRMRVDARVIARLRKTPKSAASRDRSNEELLAQVEDALSAASIDRDHWHDSIPQPPRRMPQSDYVEHQTRVYLAGIDGRQLASFAYHLAKEDATLRIAGLNMTNRKLDGPAFDIEVVIAYLVYAPKERT